MPTLKQVMARVEHEVFLTGWVADCVLRSHVVRARGALRDRVKHTTVYRMYGWSRMMLAV